MGNLECPTSAHLDLESTERLARPRAGPAQPLGERRARHHLDFRCRALHFASNFPVDSLCADFDTIFTGFTTIVQGFAAAEQRRLFPTTRSGYRLERAATAD